MGFYECSFILGYLDENDLREATRWGCLSEEEFKRITGRDYSVNTSEVKYANKNQLTYFEDSIKDKVI